MMVKRREGQTIGQPPKYIDYEDDLYKVVDIIGPYKGGALIYLCDCKLCQGRHERTAHQLQRRSRAKQCPEYRAANWSGLEREDLWLRNSYGISMQEFEDLVEFQGNKCAICFKPLESLSRRANVDHDHKTNRVRGILCTGCNTGLGHLGDDIKGLQKALYYLQNTPFDEYKRAR